MSDFRFPCRRKELLRALKKLGLGLKEGGKHTKAECVHNGRKTTIPRHNIIKREVVNSICSFLMEKDFEVDKIKRLLK